MHFFLNRVGGPAYTHYTSYIKEKSLKASRRAWGVYKSSLKELTKYPRCFLRGSNYLSYYKTQHNWEIESRLDGLNPLGRAGACCKDVQEVPGTRWRMDTQTNIRTDWESSPKWRENPSKLAPFNRSNVWPAFFFDWHKKSKLFPTCLFLPS